jgi:bla regulator protein blaR1
MDLLTGKIMTAITSVLIHSVWQGLLLAIITAGMLLFIKKDDAAKRYNLLLAASVLFLLSCIITFIWKWNNSGNDEAAVFSNDFQKPFSTLFFGNLHTVQQIFQYGIHFIFAHQQWIFTGWLLVVIYKMMRVATALLYNHRIRTRQVYEPDTYWKDRISLLSQKLHIKKTVTLLQSGYCKVPVITGHLKPFILVPLGLLAGLPADQAEAILLHELAHIRRNDYLVNCLQSILETIFFFNPGIWWLSSLIKEERENCCDDIALAQTKNRKGLAAALISFKEYELSVTSFATAFPGRKKHLLKRIMRILENKNTRMGAGEKLFFIAAAMLLVVTGSMGLLARVKEPVKPSFSQAPAGDIFLHTSVDVIRVQDHSVKNTSNQKMRAHTKTTAVVSSTTITHLVSMENLTHPGQTALTKEQQLEQARILSKTDEERAMKDQAQAKLDQQKAMIDLQQAMVQQEEARRDQVKAKLDQQQAMKDQRQAKLDQEKAMIDQEQAKKDQAQAKIDQQQALRNKKEAERSKLKIESF